eukprot:3409988-Ditylum_brightwellii.AAC.1
MEFEHGQNIDASLLKKCMHCFLFIVEKQNSSSTDGGTSTTAVQHTVTVNVHMHTSPANQIADPKSSANASRKANGKSSTPCISNLNSCVSFANEKTDPTIRRLPTTQKAVANAILKSDIVNDPNGCWFLHMDNRYAAPQLFAIMATNWNICAIGTCKAN